MSKLFAVLLIVFLSFLHYYFDGATKNIFRSVHLAKFLDTSAKLFFPCVFIIVYLFWIKYTNYPWHMLSQLV